jgi:hypothetical protein
VCARNRLSFLLALCQLACCCPLALGQTTGRIAGVVRDPSGAVIAGAEVTVRNQATGEERKVATDETGNYSAPLLPPGVYQVSVAANGFQRALFPQVRVNITETSAINAVLAVGAVSGSVTVHAAAPLVQTDGPQLGRVVDSRGVSELPLATRNITQILGLSPGTATYLPDNSAVGRNTQTISVNGARMTQNNFQINGVDANTMGSSSAVNVAVPAPESIEEFKVQTSLYDATYGRSGGGNIQVVTRSGTNSFHGAVYEYFRNDALNANNPFLNAVGVPRPALKRNVFGAAVGGPIRRDKAFLFLSYQGVRERNAASLLNSVSSGVLIDPKLTDDRSQPTLLRTFRLPIDPAALALLNTKLPNGQFLIPTPQADGRYTGAGVSRFQEDQFNTNVDYLINARNALAVKAFFANAPSVLVLPSFRGGGPNVPGFGSSQENNVRLIVIQDTHAFRANVFNEARIGYNAHRNFFVPQEPVKDSDVGIQRANANALPGLPLIRIAPAAGGVIIGTQTNIAPAFPSVATFADTVSDRRGKHALRAGAEVRYNQVVATSDAFTRGQIDFSTFNNFLIGATALSVFGSGIGDRNQRAFDYNLFFQDDWKISPKWTLNLGLRYELDLPPYDTRGRLATFDPALYRPRLATNAGVPIGPPIGGFVQAGNVVPRFDLPELPKVANGAVKSIDPNNFGPRLGFAYSPLDSGRLALRGGYGIFYSRATFQYVSTSVTVPPTYILGRRMNAPLAKPFFSVPPLEQFLTFVPGVALSGTVLDRGIRTPYFYQYNLSVQYEWMKDLLLEVAYVGTRGLNLFRQVAINQARLASPQNPIRNEVAAAVITTNTTGNATLRAPFQGVEINSFFQNQTTAQSTYNSLQVSLTKRVSRGLQFLASYQYAKSIDNGSGTGGGAGISGVVNPGSVADTSVGLGNQLNNRANRGVSDFDRTHRLVLSYLWDLPRPHFTEKSRASRWLLADWQLAGIITAMSGLPIDIVDTGAGSFYGLDRGSNPLARPNLASGATCRTATHDAPQGYFFNPFVFVRPVVQAGQPIPSSGGTAVAGEPGTDIGNVGRNCLRGPSQVNVDLAIGKRFPVRESSSFEFRAEFFNLFNHVNLANPISDLNAVSSSGGSLNATGRIINPGAFGRIISTSNNPRLIQVAMKFTF